MIERAEELVTIFGGGGFIGRYVCEFLMKQGVRVRVAQRDPRNAYIIQPLAQVGQYGLAAADVVDFRSVRAAVKGATAVINLCGVFGRGMQAVHVDGARHVAEAARDEGAGALVHISAIGADPDSPSYYGRSKGEGEHEVRTAFPAATILRPSVVFGREDEFINKFAAMARLLPVLPVVRGPAKFQPVYAADVGKAVAAAIADPAEHGGKTYELGGPQVLTMHELNQWIVETIGRRRPLIDIPDPIGELGARLFGWLPGAPITSDQWLMLRRDNVVADGAQGLRAFGITPTPLAAVADGWLTSYRRHGRFAAKQPY